MNLINRRTFCKTALVAGSSGVAPLLRAAEPATTQPAQSQPGAAVPPLGNGKPPALQFQACPGGTGAYLERLAHQRGREAIERQDIGVEAWQGPVPSSEEQIAFLPVHRLAALLKARVISAVDLTRIYLDRLKRLDPVLLCAVTILEGPSREAAQQADTEIKAGKNRGPLHGIPWGVKDLFAVRGAPTTWGANEFQDRVIDEDAEIVVRLRQAGAILIAKLATGRFALGDMWYRGRTKNPWNLQQGSSGSSAGPASATAAGCVAFGIGTETRGSIVSPAMRCGLSAFRPTFGRVSRHGGMVLAWSMDRVGPICRTIEDCALVFNAIHGADQKDPSTVTAPFQWERKCDLSKLRIGFDAQAPKDFVEKLREMGADPKPMPPCPSPRGLDCLGPESAAAFDSLFATGVLQDIDAPNGGRGHGRFTSGRSVSAVDYLQTLRRRQILCSKMAKLIEDFDLYVSGSGDIELTSLTGHPAVIVPRGFREGEHAQPVCTTLIGNLFEDDKVLSVAHAYQTATTWHERHPVLEKT